MTFAVDMKLLRCHPFTWVKAEPGRAGRWEAYFRLDPAEDVVAVELRPLDRSDKFLTDWNDVVWTNEKKEG